MRQTEEQRERVLEEILNPVDFYDEGDGPNGPWKYKTLNIRREMNEIRIRDVDGVLQETIEVGDYNSDNIKEELRDDLETINEESLEEL